RVGEAVRANGMAQVWVCGGGARCSTCRVLVTKGLEQLPEPGGLEAKALARIGATSGMRLACQIRPTADIAVLPLMPADAGAADGSIRGGGEGRGGLITLLFTAFRASTRFARGRVRSATPFILT